MLDYILGYAVFPVMDAVTGCLRRFRFLSRLQWDPVELQRWQDDRLRSLISHAYSTVPCYRQAYDAAGISAEDVRKNSNDLSKLPIITKADLRKGFPDKTLSTIISHRRMRLSHTSGSTGLTFHFYDDKNIRGYVLASRLLFESWMGLKLGDRTVKLTSWDFPKLRTRLIGEVRIPPQRLEEDILAAIRLIRSYRPASLLGSVSVLSSLANRVLHAGTDARMGLLGIATTGEILSSNDRRQIEKAFESVVFDRNGLAEVAGYVAQQCDAREGLHVNGGLTLIDVVKDGESCAPGETGRVVITNLHNYAMPFIRYDTEDTATLSDGCSCGRAFQVLTRIGGRSADWIITDSFPISFTLYFSAFEAMDLHSIEQFQFVQKKIGELTLLIKPKTALTIEQICAATVRLNSINRLVKVEISTVDSIEPTSSGKHLLFKSSLSTGVR